MSNSESVNKVVEKYVASMKESSADKVREAFHPNATQYTLDLGKKIYGLWRQSKDKRQSIFSVTNITSESVEFNLNRLNLIKNETWRDLINPKTKINGKNNIRLKPFETLWISNN